MIFAPKEITMKNGCTCTLRNACAEDAAILIEYLKKTTGETPFLAKEPDEVTCLKTLCAPMQYRHRALSGVQRSGRRQSNASGSP